MIAIHKNRKINDEEINNHVVITSSAVRDKVQAATDGCLLLNKWVSFALCEVKSISGRLMQATLAGNPELTLI